MEGEARIVWSVGHSTHSLERFVELLRGQGTTRLVDIRRFPKSRRSPHFHREELARVLEDARIEYFWLESLGRFKKMAGGGGASGWATRDFAGYAQYMGTTEFEAGLERLLDIAATGPTAMMCAEGLWWRCHRRLVGDALTAINITVIHILQKSATTEHRLTQE
jgi:uncharacterized protein (DUF488 family)